MRDRLKEFLASCPDCTAEQFEAEFAAELNISAAGVTYGNPYGVAVIRLIRLIQANRDLFVENMDFAKLLRFALEYWDDIVEIITVSGDVGWFQTLRAVLELIREFRDFEQELVTE